VLVVLVVVLAGMLGYVTLIKKSQPLLEEKFEEPSSSQAVKKQATSPAATSSTPAVSLASIDILSPKNGETLCVNKPTEISWKGDESLKNYIEIWIGNLSVSYRIGSFPVSRNETGKGNYGSYEWIVGKVTTVNNQSTFLNDGSFEMYIAAEDSVSGIITSKKHQVNLVLCEG